MSVTPPPVNPVNPTPDAAPAALAERLRASGSVFAEEEAQLLMDAAQTPGQLADLVEQRIAGTPLEHVLGWAQFCGLRIAVGPGVFVPRLRTELIVQEALARAAGLPRPVVVLDLCCGSGAVAAALAAQVGQAEVYAADIDPVAVDYARRNLADTGTVFAGDLYQPLPDELRGRVGLLTANAPFVPTGSIALLPAEARRYEPRHALDGGDDGLDVLRRVIAGARPWLAPGGQVIVQASERQSAQLAEAMAQVGLAPQVVTSDALDATVVAGADRGDALRARW